MVELEQWSQTYTSSVQATPQNKTIETSVVVKGMGYRKWDLGLDLYFFMLKVLFYVLKNIYGLILGERETDRHRFVVPLIYAFIGWFF